MRRPSGVNDGSTSMMLPGALASTVGALRPSAATIAIWADSGSSTLKAILRPSGDQSALVASPSTWVIWRRSRPFGRTVKISLPSAVSLWKASSPLWPGGGGMRRRSEHERKAAGAGRGERRAATVVMG